MVIFGVLAVSLTFSHAAGGPDLTACNFALSQVRAAIEATHPDLAAKLGQVMAQLGQSRDPQTVVHGLEAAWQKAVDEGSIRFGDAIPETDLTLAGRMAIQSSNATAVIAIRRSLLPLRGEPAVYSAAVEWFNVKLDQLRRERIGSDPAIEAGKLEMTADVIEGVRRVIDWLFHGGLETRFVLPASMVSPGTLALNAEVLLSVRERWIESLRGTIYFESAANLYDDAILRLLSVRALVNGTPTYVCPIRNDDEFVRNLRARR